MILKIDYSNQKPFKPWVDGLTPSLSALWTGSSVIEQRKYFNL